MGIFFVYILKSAVCLAVFYLFYRLLLSRETFHRFNRFGLLGILLLSCLLPLIEVTGGETEMHHTMMTLEQMLLAAEAMAEEVPGMLAEQGVAGWIQAALALYLAGIVFFAFRNVCSLGRLLLLLKSGKRVSIREYVDTTDEVRLLIHEKDIAPFSWMKYIVLSRKDLEENGREILIHELAHIRNRHSWDLLVADICIFFQWFNPASWLLKQELQNIHEYEADAMVLREGVDAKQYQLLLIKKAVGTRLYSMANSFNHSKLKKRITMMLKEKSSPWACLKYLYVLPVAAIAVTAFARPEISGKVEEISAVKVNDLAAIVETKVAENANVTTEQPVAVALPADTVKPADVKYVPVEVKEQLTGTVFEVVEQMPEFPDGGMSGLMEYFRKNMRYPKAAKEAGTQGRVTVQFVVDKDGSIKDVRVLRSVDKEMDAEAIRLVKTMPKWKPGTQRGVAVPVRYTVPVAFRLGDALSLGSTPDTEPLYIVDGKEVTKSIMEALNPGMISTMKILKNKGDTDPYGEKGKNGVILITLKSGGAALAPKSVENEQTATQGAMKVEGKVVDEQGNPVIGASVLVEGTKMGTVTDVDGNFVQSVPSKDAVLVVSFIDMSTAKVKAQPKVTVILKSE